MSATVIAALALALPVLAVPASAVSNPGGLAALFFSRRARWRYRRWLVTRRVATRPRSRQRSSRISAHLRAMVERADRHQCVACGARARPGAALQVDHMVPWIMGGLTCLWNSALLCRRCNVIKSCYWVAPSGRVYYRGRGHPPAAAPVILAAEVAARRSPLRWLRAYGLAPSW